MITILYVLAALLVAGLLLFRFNQVWIFLFDRAKRNSTSSLAPDRYEHPQYLKLNAQGQPDLAARWPGWDGWYFFVLPDDSGLPVKMVRGSLMTGTYGLEGIDNYDILQFRLSTFDVAEFLCLVPTEMKVEGKRQRHSLLSHHYLPRRDNLEIRSGRLDVRVAGRDPKRDEVKQFYGQISGAWPNYRMNFRHPEAGISIQLDYSGKNILWWADLPGVFTYFATIGRFEGEIRYEDGVERPDAHQIEGPEARFPIRGFGAFEHGFARKAFDFDPLFLPVRLLKLVLPVRPIRYHYELFLDEAGMQGGFMLARAFGVAVRNLGGLFLEGSFRRIQDVRIEYDESSREVVDHAVPERAVYYRRWKVRARAGGGVLEYTAVREFPPAPVAPHMTYYHFRYEGSYQGRRIAGRGYGEYAHL